jgi:hypothetical protein
MSTELKAARRGTRDAAARAAAQLGGGNLAAATVQVIEDASILQRACVGKRNVDVCRGQGTAFEHLEVLKFNRDAARMDSPYRATATYALGPHDPVDIRIVDPRLDGPAGTVLEVQCKSRLHASDSLRDLADEKYTGMGRLAPSDQIPEIHERLRSRLEDPVSPRHPGYEDVDDHLLDTLEHDDVRSPGTTRAEAERTAASPGVAALRMALAEASREIAAAAAKGAIAGGIVGAGAGAVAATRTRRGEPFDAAGVAKQAGRDGLRGAGRGAVVAGGGKAISIASRRVAPRFAGSAGPAVVASAGVELTQAVTQYVAGTIDADELREQSTRAIVGAGAGLWCGAVGQILIPVPVVGGLVGSLLGAFVADVLVDSGLFGSTASSRAADERLGEMERVAEMAMAAFQDFEREMDEELRAHDARMQHLVLPALDRLETAQGAGDMSATIRELTTIGAAIGVDVPFHDVEDLRRFAQGPGCQLVL